jgi:galactose-6-phosphate isomerase
MSPMMDVSVALTNPYTLDSFSVLRRPENINTYGEGSTADTTIDGLYGVIYPEGNQGLERLAEEQRQLKVIAVITKFALRGSSKQSGQNYQPDTVIWNGNNFVVENVEDYSRYGPGFIKATCTIIDMITEAPSTNA